MLQGKCRVQWVARRWVARAVLLAGWACLAATGADPLVTPMSVCEVVRDLPGMDGKDVAVLGRYSYRPDGRWVSEQSCDPPAAASPQLWLVEDSAQAPKPPVQYQFDSAALHKKLAEIERRTSLGRFPFGTPGYDRWAVVYGRVEARKRDDARKIPANLLFRGSGVVVWVQE